MKVSAQTLAIPIFKVSQGTCPPAPVFWASPKRYSVFLCQNTALPCWLGLAVLLVLPAASRLVFGNVEP